jgi:hypothetical protein
MLRRKSFWMVLGLVVLGLGSVLGVILVRTLRYPLI